MNIQYTAKLSPQLNPIELLWNKLKKIIQATFIEDEV